MKKKLISAKEALEAITKERDENIKQLENEKHNLEIELGPITDEEMTQYNIINEFDFYGKKILEASNDGTDAATLEEYELRYIRAMRKQNIILIKREIFEEHCKFAASFVDLFNKMIAKAFYKRRYKRAAHHFKKKGYLLHEFEEFWDWYCTYGKGTVLDKVEFLKQRITVNDFYDFHTWKESEYLQKQKHAPGAPEFNDDFKSLFVDDNSMFLAIDLAKKHVTDDNLRWKFGERGGKSKIVTFWKVISDPKHNLTSITKNDFDFDNSMLLPCQVIAKQFQVPKGIAKTTVRGYIDKKQKGDIDRMTNDLVSMLEPEK